MSIVHAPVARFQPVRPSYHAADHVDSICRACGTALSVPSDSTPPLCRDCQRSQVMAEVGRLLDDIRDLRAGSGMFALLTQEERDEQLAGLGLPAAGAKLKYPGFRKLPDDTLIQIVAGGTFVAAGETAEEQIAEAVAELCRRLEPTEEPHPAPRDQEEMERTAIVVAGEPDEYDADRWDSAA